MSRCGFASTAYAAAQSTAADTIVVAATRPTNAAQLTTTFTAGGVGVATGTGTAGGIGAASPGLVTAAGAVGREPFINGWNIMVASAVFIALVAI